MSQRLTPVSRTELIARFRRLGWDGPRSGGNHAYMTRGPRKVRIPNPHRGDIGVGRVAMILSQAGISRDDWHNAAH